MSPKVKPFKMEPMDKKGDITHKIVEANVYLPIVMQDLSDPYFKVMWLAETSGRDVFQLNERHSRMSNHSFSVAPFPRRHSKCKTSTFTAAFLPCRP